VKHAAVIAALITGGRSAGLRVYSGGNAGVQLGYSRFIAGGAKEDAVQVALNMAF
jgi:hypothetical protein